MTIYTDKQKFIQATNHHNIPDSLRELIWEAMYPPNVAAVKKGTGITFGDSSYMGTVYGDSSAQTPGHCWRHDGSDIHPDQLLA